MTRDERERASERERERRGEVREREREREKEREREGEVRERELVLPASSGNLSICWKQMSKTLSEDQCKWTYKPLMRAALGYHSS